MHCNLQFGITEPILQLFWHICNVILTFAQAHHIWLSANSASLNRLTWIDQPSSGKDQTKGRFLTFKEKRVILFRTLTLLATLHCRSTPNQIQWRETLRETNKKEETTTTTTAAPKEIRPEKAGRRTPIPHVMSPPSCSAVQHWIIDLSLSWLVAARKIFVIWIWTELWPSISWE